MSSAVVAVEAEASSGPPRGPWAVRELAAVFGERNRVTARFLRAAHAAGRAVAEGASRDGLDEFSGDEVAAALGWSRSMAGRWLELADDLVGRLPAVLALMEQGSLDEGKARIFSEWTRDLCHDHAAAVVARLLVRAPGWCNAALIEAVEQTAVALDPDWAARREARARRRARVAGAMTPAGTATLAGYDLPVDEAVEALARVESLAAAVRARGVREVPIARLRAIVYLRLLDGTSLSRFPCKQRVVDGVNVSEPESAGEVDDQGVERGFPAVGSGAGFASSVARYVA